MRTKATSEFFFALCLAIHFISSAAWWNRRRRSQSPPPRCVPRPCSVTWTSWSSCSCPCGYGCTKTRHRRITTPANSCGSCPYLSSDTKPCNTDSSLCNYGVQRFYGCSCRQGWKGTCCQNGEYNAIQILVYCFIVVYKFSPIHLFNILEI